MSAWNKVAIICKKHGVFWQKPQNHLMGKGCKKCAVEININSKRKTQEEVHGIFKNSRCELLDVYESNHKLMKFKCSCGEVSFVSLSNFQRGSRCKKCRYEKNSASLRLDFNYVKNYFKENGCELLETEYVNARRPLQYKCECGSISKICFFSFKNGNRCKECGNKKSGFKQTLSNDFVFNKFKEAGCKLLGEYVSAQTPMKYICSCGNTSLISWNNFQQNKRCAKCGVERRSGKYHYEWREDRDAVKEEYSFRQRLYKILKHALISFGQKKHDHSSKLLGYSYKELADHIKKHPNWGKVKDGEWHLDHIFPIKAFVDYGIHDVRIVNSLDNLQPLNAFDNISKNDQYDKLLFESYLISKGISWT